MSEEEVYIHIFTLKLNKGRMRGKWKSHEK